MLNPCLGWAFCPFHPIYWDGKIVWNGLKIVWKNDVKNYLTLLISKWYELLRFKDIVQGFEKLKKIVEKKWVGLED